MATGSTAVDGTDDLSALGLSLRLVDGGIQPVLASYLGAVDDPATAAGVVDPTDVATVAENLPDAVDGLLHGDSFGGGLIEAIEQALRGNLVFDSGVGAIGMPAMVGNTFNGTGFGLTTLLAGTTLEPLVLPVAAVLLIAAIGGADYFLQLEEALAPAFEALAPATDAVIDALDDL